MFSKKEPIELLSEGQRYAKPLNLTFSALQKGGFIVLVNATREGYLCAVNTRSRLKVPASRRLKPWVFLIRPNGKIDFLGCLPAGHR